MSDIIITSTPKGENVFYQEYVKSNGLTLNDFKLVKNKQRPNMCYKYVRKIDDFKYTIFTLNGSLFYCSIERMRLDNKYYSVSSDEFLTIDECLEFLNKELGK